jgi:hypothetical protein
MDYTHLVGDDDRRVVEQLDDLFLSFAGEPNGREDHVDAKFEAGIL